MNRIDGKVAVITGGTQGLGAAIANLFAEAGAHGIVIVGRDHKKGETVASKISRTYGVQAKMITADLGGSFEHDNFRIVWLSFAHNIFTVRRTFGDYALQIFTYCISAYFRRFGFWRTSNRFHVSRCSVNPYIRRVHYVARKSSQKWFS